LAIFVLSCGQGAPQALQSGEVAVDAADQLAIPADAGDVILISIDTLRADHLPFYGYERATAGDVEQPFSLAWLAERAQVYEQAWAPIGKTLPSLASVWTGGFPLEHGAISNPTPLRLPSFAQAFESAGYSTHALVANRALSPGCGLEQGFASYDILAKQQEGDIPKTALARVAPALTKSQPLMLWAHFMAPHQPYTPPEEMARRLGADPLQAADNETLYQFHRWPERLTAQERERIVALYDAEIATASQWVQDLLVGLDQAYRDAGRGPLLEAATIVFFSDHGEELAERHGYFLHAKSLYAGVLRVPLFVVGRGRSTERVTRPTTLMSVVPMALGMPTPDVEYWYSSWQSQFYAVRDARWTLVHNPGRNPRGPYEPPTDADYDYPGVALYDREADPLELKNVAADHPPHVERLLGQLSGWYSSLEQRKAEFLPGTNPHVKMQQLKELGYIDKVPNEVEKPWTVERWQAWRDG